MTKKSNLWMRTKVLYLIPAVAISFCAIACSDSSESDPNEVYEKVEIMPEYPGGLESMMNFMKENMKYPDELADSCVLGRVVVSFIINEDGIVERIILPKQIKTKDHAAQIMSELKTEN